MNIDSISTGCLDLDIAFGIGGLPRGRIIEIYGPESSGKTTVALTYSCRSTKKWWYSSIYRCRTCLDPVYAKALGVDIDNLIISQPDTGEQALRNSRSLIRSGAIDIIVVDSVAALSSKS